jgi:hypothetical protein
MEKNKVVAYWNIYDSETGSVIEKEKAIMHDAMPSIGGLIIGIPGKFNAIVRNFRFNGIKDNLPCYDVYV